MYIPNPRYFCIAEIFDGINFRQFTCVYAIWSLHHFLCHTPSFHTLRRSLGRLSEEEVCVQTALYLSSWQRRERWPPGGGQPALQHKILRETNCKNSIVPSSGPVSESIWGGGGEEEGKCLVLKKKFGVGGVGSKYETYGTTS